MMSDDQRRLKIAGKRLDKAYQNYVNKYNDLKTPILQKAELLAAARQVQKMLKGEEDIGRYARTIPNHYTRQNIIDHVTATERAREISKWTKVLERIEEKKRQVQAKLDAVLLDPTWLTLPAAPRQLAHARMPI